MAAAAGALLLLLLGWLAGRWRGGGFAGPSGGGSTRRRRGVDCKPCPWGDLRGETTSKHQPRAQVVSCWSSSRGVQWSGKQPMSTPEGLKVSRAVVG